MLATQTLHETPTIIDLIRNGLGVLAFAIAVLGAIVLAWGIIVALFSLIAAERCRLRGDDPRPRQRQLRHTLGMYILIGLEILVVADIIETIAAPSLMHLAVLGAIVLIRIVISVALNWELSQHRESSEST